MMAEKEVELDAARWRFCLEFGFPLRGPQWVQRLPNGLFVCGDSAIEAVDNAMISVTRPDSTKGNE